jgi:transcriptional regulator with XRE-family HTH domain
VTEPIDVDPDEIANKDEFAAALTAVRARAGLTVRDVAKAVGVPFQTIGDYFVGKHLPPRSSDVLERILGACGVDEPQAWVAWAAALRRIRRAPGPRTRPGATPYLGLSSFQPEHADWFFGREQLTEVLLERLGRGDGLVFVVGASGSGKSSLLRAGLIPAATAGRLSPGGAWSAVVLTPGSGRSMHYATRSPRRRGAESGGWSSSTSSRSSSTRARTMTSGARSCARWTR